MGNTTFAEKCSGVSINKVSIPNIFPNINAYRNVLLTGTPFSVALTIPVGQYTGVEFATALTAAIPVNIVVTYVGDRFIFTNNEITTEVIDAIPEVWDYLGWNWRELPQVGVSGTYRLDLAAGPGAAESAPFTSALFGERLVHISCDKLSHGNLVYGEDGKLYDILCTVPLGERPFNFVAVWEPSDEKSYKINYRYVNSISSTLDFQLFDSRMRPLPFPPNHHLFIVLRLYHKEHEH